MCKSEADIRNFLQLLFFKWDNVSHWTLNELSDAASSRDPISLPPQNWGFRCHAIYSASLKKKAGAGVLTLHGKCLINWPMSPTEQIKHIKSIWHESKKAKLGCWIPLSWSYGQLWAALSRYWKLNLGPLHSTISPAKHIKVNHRRNFHFPMSIFLSCWCYHP